MTDHDVDKAYALTTPESARALYDDWAPRYDAGFADSHGYAAPRAIAAAFRHHDQGDTPVLDVGAGTGLLAEAMTGAVVDGLDISAQMLTVAAEKGLYRQRIVADVLAPLAIADATYGAVISAGTFTHGHVGPACLPELLRICRPGALFVCGCVPAVYDGMGFGSALAMLNAQGVIGPLQFHDIAIYEGKDHAHAQDRGLVMVFRKL